MSDRRSIATKWTCQRDGTCCMGPALVVTTAELRAMEAAKGITIPATALDREFAQIDMPNGCQFLERSLDGQASCGIYEARPVNCRRFQCLRPDVTTEPFEHGGPLGCRNLSDRLDQSLHALTFYQANQRRAMREWGTSHGWHR